MMGRGKKDVRTIVYLRHIPRVSRELYIAEPEIRRPCFADNDVSRAQEGFDLRPEKGLRYVGCVFVEGLAGRGEVRFCEDVGWC